MSPQAQFRFHAAFLGFWALMLPLTILTSLKTSLTYIGAISVWALILGHYISANQARAEAQRAALTEEVREHRHHVRLFHRRVSEKLDIDPPT